MQMTVSEIECEYRQAKNKLEQLKILADENSTTVDEIKKILVSTGKYTDRGKVGLYPVEYKKPKSNKETVQTTEVTEKAETAPCDWRVSLKILSDRVAELMEIRDEADRELTEIMQAVGKLGA